MVASTTITSRRSVISSSGASYCHLLYLAGALEPFLGNPRISLVIETLPNTNAVIATAHVRDPGFLKLKGILDYIRIVAKLVEVIQPIAEDYQKNPHQKTTTTTTKTSTYPINNQVWSFFSALAQ
ncbi:hypothetical protein RRG08_003967 [Elysia crispata]|uniref:Uncharacterized protein n=1 Tax=Elysia crispata TaxID=231223 RepID=A0AAE1DF25_9GAST|nr:hypothetical protein RRG08_003967 [Elysia crispata]